MRIKIISQYDPNLPPTEANRKMIHLLSRGLADRGEEVDLEVIVDPVVHSNLDTLRCHMCNWRALARPAITGRAGICPVCGSTNIECPEDRAWKGDGTWSPLGEMVTYRAPFRSALGLVSCNADLLVVQSTMGWRVFPVLTILRAKAMPHLACIYNAMLMHFWEKRYLGVPLAKWYSHVHNVGVYCRFQADILDRVLPGAEAHLLPPIVDDFPLTRSPTEKPSLLYIGSFQARYGTDLLLRAARELEKARPDLTIQMAIRYQNGLEMARSRVREMGLSNVRLMGKVDIWEALSKAWMFVYPYQGIDPPSVPLSIVEAIKSGTPVVAVAKGGIPEILPPENLFDGTLDGLLGSIRMHLDGPTIPPCPERFLLGNALSTYMDIYRRIVEGS